jgi:hypothetical protein
MHGIAPDKPFDERTLRKFSAGIWFEQQIGYILARIGILKVDQDWIAIPGDEDHLKVTGRLDFVAGGLSDWKLARDRVANAGFPDFIANVSYNLIDHFEKEYPKGLREKVIEVKSVNSQVFWNKKDYLEKAYPHHVMQLYTYLKAKKIKDGTILYISKDDLTIKECHYQYPDKNLELLWDTDVRTMTKHYQQKIEPPKPDPIVFDDRKKLRFQKDKKPIVLI